MKKIIFILIATTFVLTSCKKDKEDEPVADYTSSVIGTFLVSEQYAESASGPNLFTSTNTTLTVTKSGDNEVVISGFHNATGGSGGLIKFTLTSLSSDIIKLTPVAPFQERGSCTFNTSTKYMSIGVKHSTVEIYKYFQGTKQ